jgi:5,10-methylenetetrahydromethanopterin reductase
MDLGLLLTPRLGRTGALAATAEAAGFSTLLLTDSQNLVPEVWSQLHLAAAATKTIHLGTGVTNSVTRDAAVTASAALSLQAESGGRAVIGIGRGDSAVQRIGRDVDSVANFGRYLARLQTYLRGESTDRKGFASRIEWHRAVQQPKVPVQVAATGPRVIDLAARVADAVIFAVGADPAHLGECLARARAGADSAGRAPGSVRYGAFVTTIVHSDLSVAREAVRGTAATFARFSSFKGSPLESLPAPLREAAQHLRAHYDMREHTRTTAEHVRGLGDAFVDWFAIAGPPDHAVRRFRALRDLGLDFVYAVSGSADTARDVSRTSLKLLATEILPAVR